MYVRAKKALGQHFLKDEGIAKRIVDSLVINGRTQVLEIGPGTGVLTKYLLANPDIKLEVAEIDPESIACLQELFPQLLYSLQQRDFLKIPLEKIFQGRFAVIGNFPYNISSQIFFRILDYKDSVPQVVCMLQREVAQRLTSGPGNKSYGILSVLLQAWYDTEYLFTVDEHLFLPPPQGQIGRNKAHQKQEGESRVRLFPVQNRCKKPPSTNAENRLPIHSSPSSEISSKNWRDSICSACVQNNCLSNNSRNLQTGCRNQTIDNLSFGIYRIYGIQRRTLYCGNDTAYHSYRSRL